MRIAVFSAKNYDRQFLSAGNETHGHELTYFEPPLNPDTARLAEGYECVCVFVNDEIQAPTLQKLHDVGVRLIVLRCAGFNNVDLPRANELGLTVARVPAYSPTSVAEHTVALMLTLNRKIHRAVNRVREGNFSLEGLLGFDMANRTVGVVGTGKIGAAVTRIMHGFGCELLVYDVHENPELLKLGARYVTLKELAARSNIITLHCPLVPETRHIINAASIQKMRDGVMLINTSRGGLLDARAVIAGLKSGKIGYLGLDVYEEEADLFFEDLSDQIIHDDTFMRMVTFPNVVITGHQAFFTAEALQTIADVTLSNATEFERGGAIKPENLVSAKPAAS